DSSEYPKYHLDEKRCLHQSTVDEMREVIEMAHVVTFVFELGARLGHARQDRLYVPKCVPEDVVVRINYVVLFPVVLPLVYFACSREKGKIDRAHIQRTKLGLEAGCCSQSFTNRHRGRPTGRNVHDRIAALLDDREKLGV